MKKLMCAIGAAAIAGIAMADISSANIVGYNTVFVKGDRMNLLTCSFETVGGSEDEADLNAIMDVSRLVPWDWDNWEAKDYIDTWDMEAGDWGPTYYVDVNLDTGTNRFVDQDLNPVDVVVKAGASLWLFHVGEDLENFTFAGQVATGVKGYTLVGGRMNLCGNPYPTSLNLNDPEQVVITGATGWDWDAWEAKDYVDTWDFTTADWGPTYYYDNGQFADQDLNPVDDTAIQPGAGFWYFATEDGVTLSFTGIK